VLGQLGTRGLSSCPSTGAESFNNWIKQYRSMNLDDFVDKIR
jgi:hypothetical protein